MKRKLLTASGIGMVAILISGALIGVALAADPTPTFNGSTQQTFIAKLARILGIQEQQLTDAIKKANIEIVDEALGAGKLTQDRASSLKDRIDKSNGWGPVPGGHGGPGARGFGKGFGPMHGNEMADIASFLGMTLEDLTAELRQGKTLAQVAEAHGKTRDQLKRTIVAGIQKHLDQAVASGRLTKEKADEMMKNAGAHADSMLDGTFKAPNGWPRGNSRITPNS